MVIDASAIVAILHDEPEAARFAALIDADPRILLSPINLLEAHIVSRRRGELGIRRLEQFIAAAGMSIYPVDDAQAAIA